MSHQRILIIKPSALGDVATTLPVLCDLNRAYPNAQIDWLIHPALIPLIEGHDALHEAIPFDRKRLASWWYNPSAFKLFMALLKKLRQRHYDLVIDAQGLFRSGFLSRITGAQIRIGFANAREFAPIFYTKKVKLPNNGNTMLAVDRMRALLQPLDINTKGPAEFRLPVRTTNVRLADDKLKDLPLTDVIALIPGARWNTKRWPIDRYTQIAQHLLTEGHTILLLGSPDEKPLCDQIQQSIGKGQLATGNLHNLAGQTSLAEMIFLLSRAKLVIGNDSGPLHVAVALGRPILGLYGPTAPAFVGPYGQLDNVLRHDVPCHPCRRKECDHHSCMNGLTVELVWEKTRKASTAAPITGR